MSRFLFLFLIAGWCLASCSSNSEEDGAGEAQKVEENVEEFNFGPNPGA